MKVAKYMEIRYNRDTSGNASLLATCLVSSSLIIQGFVAGLQPSYGVPILFIYGYTCLLNAITVAQNVSGVKSGFS